MHSGFDGTCEEMHFIGAGAGQERGYNVLTFDGPGQPAALHLEGLTFRPDWEHVITPVLNWVLTLPRSIRTGSRCSGHPWAACWRRGSSVRKPPRGLCRIRRSL